MACASVDVRAATSPTSTMKILSHMKSLFGEYHSEVVHLRLEREIDTKKSSVYMIFSCLIYNDVVVEESVLIIPPCCRAVVVCLECWLETWPLCPHCREPLAIDNCVKLSVLRLLFDLLAQYDSDH